MDEIKNISSLLEKVQLNSNTKFEYDKNAIHNEYQIQKEQKSSLAIKVLSVFGGFVATLAFLGFLIIAGLYDSGIGLVIFGLGFIVMAIGLNKVYDILIIDTFSISSYVIGFALLAIGLTELDYDENFITLTICLISIVSLLITQNYMLSFISVITFAGSIIVLIFSNEIYDLIHLYITTYTLFLTYFFLYEAKVILLHKKWSKLYNPIRIGLIFSLLFGLIAIGKRDLTPMTQGNIWLSSIVMFVVILYLVGRIIDIFDIETIKSKIGIYTLSGLIFISTIFSPSISGAMLILLLSFLVNYKTGIAIGIIAIIYFISQYYYDLNFTLLTKSIMLMISGLIFILFYLFTSKKMNVNEKI